VDTNAVVEAARFLAERLAEKGVAVSRLILFGSQAKGVAAEESDIDLLVISEAFRGKDIFQRVEMTKEAEVNTVRRFVVPLDIIAMTPEEYEQGDSLIADMAREEGVLIESGKAAQG